MNREQIAYEKGYRVTKDGNLLNPKGDKIGSINNHGYERTTIKINSKDVVIKTHRLQAYQKYGDKLYEDGIVVRHLNGNALDNSWDNIATGTQVENLKDIPLKQRQLNALQSAHKRIKHPKEFVDELKEEYRVLKSYAKLSRKFNLSYDTTYYLINQRKVFKDA
jgi:hypothetical protein